MQDIKQLLINKEIPYQYPEIISRIKTKASDKYYIDKFDFINLSSFVLAAKRWVKPLSDFIGNKKCLEIMAGKGVLSKCLSDFGTDIIATDDYSWKWHRNQQQRSGQVLKQDELWYDVENLDCLKSIEKYGSDAGFIICCHPPFGDESLYKSLIKMREINIQCRLIYVGEGRGGCHAEDKFFNEAVYIKDDIIFNYAANLYQSWSSLNDNVNLIK